MMDLIRKRDIDYISAPIAPVLKGEKVHYEYVAFRKQIEDISPIPAIPISVIEQIKADIADLNKYKFPGCGESLYYNAAEVDFIIYSILKECKE